MTAILDQARNPQRPNGIESDSTREVSEPATQDVSWRQASAVQRHAVAALTATVKVLMIGSQQMSVGLLRQLDVLPAADIEPLARVRTRPLDGTAIELVGVTAEGVLAAAVIKPPSWKGAGSIEFDHWADHMHPGWIGKTVAVGSDRGRRLTWVTSAFSHPPQKSLRIRCGRAYLKEQWQADAAAELAEIVAAQDAYEAAQRLPLILVPGVR